MTESNETSLKDFLFADVICHTLLSLYMHVAYSKRRVPAHSRNDILLKHLKGYLKIHKYKPVKADIRRLINYGRTSGMALEDKVLEIQSMSTSCSVPIIDGSDLSRFQKCLEQLNSLCRIDAESDSKSGVISSDTLYLNREEVIGSFDTQGNLITPINIYVPSGKWIVAVEVCEGAGWHLANHSHYRNTHTIGTCTLSTNA